MKLATHTVIGYPNLKTSAQIVAVLAQHSDIVELQIPFSDPVADGPVIAEANYHAVENGVTPQDCLKLAAKVAKQNPETDFYFMSYYNPIFRFGVKKFVKAAQRAGVRGFIVPDLPVEEADELSAECKKNKLGLVFVIAPNTTNERLQKISKKANDWIYCVARLGITGDVTSFGKELKKYLARVKRFTKLPLGVGFGVKSKKDLQQIKKSGGEIGIVGSELFRVYESKGLKGLDKFLKSL
jgi:tryptophan synthase alpha chain